ncbi:nardilysin-like [Mycetomoellerius zeteki]|uniref:nardilysin-like n=1 Tax=Mycetomoellerius zeteki TaxID=64791 RepID=UPI00084EBA41|nr:PREDICTED: nardilysin-like [Trachymyrmex zeteki]
MQKVEQATGDKKSCQVEYLETPVKSENDKKEYRAIRLPNGVEVLLISDENLKTCSSQQQDMKNEMKAACSLCLRTGIFKEPPEFPGISFFFEHILVTEYEKYCQKYDLEKIAYKHGGTCTSFLNLGCTSFIFDIQEKHFLSVLIPFAEFFINPLPEKEAFMQNRDVKKELRKALNFAKDTAHEPQLSSFTRTDHPINKITEERILKVLENLNYTKLYEELQKFTKRHYSARRIKLVIQARLPLNTLEQYVTIDTRFVNIPTNEISPNDSTEFKNDIPFDTAAFQKMYKVYHSKHFRQLEITWIMPSLFHLYKSKPYRYISRLIEHQGKGSLISYLRKKMWIIPFNDELCHSTHTFTYCLFKIIIDLSNEGKQHMMEVLEGIFSYINLLKKEGPQKRIYDEFSKSTEIKLRYLDEKHPADNVKDLCINLHLYPSRDYITGSTLYFEYDPEVITKILDYLTPETANITIFGKDFDSLELDKVDSWSKACYTDIEISQKWIEHWKSIEPLPNFYLPIENECFDIERLLEIMPTKVPKYPVKWYSDSVSELWYRPDPKFGLPKSYMYIHIISHLGLQSPENAALISVYCNMIKRLVDESCSTVQTGYVYDIDVSGKGIIIKISGPVPLLLLLTITRCMMNCSNQVTKKMFEIIRDQQVDAYNCTFSRPEKLAEDVRLWILKLVHYTYIDMHNALQHISFEDFQNFAKSFTNRLYIQFLAQGNITQDVAIESMRHCVKTFKCDSLHSSMMQPNRVFQIPLGTSCCKLKNIDKLDPTSFVINTYQVDPTSIESSVIMNLIIMIMDNLFSPKYEFDDLIRHFSGDFMDVDGILEYSITAKSVADELSTTKRVEQCIDRFLADFKDFLDKFSENDLEDVKERLRIFKQHADMNVGEEVNRNWNEIMKCQYMFDRHEREILVLNEIKINELREFFEKYTWNENYMKKLSVHVIGTDPNKVQPIALEYVVDEHQCKNIDENYIINVEEYKSNLFVYPVTEY